MIALVWTKEQPTAPGRYWLRCKAWGLETVADVVRCPSGALYLIDPVPLTQDISCAPPAEWEWAGPIPEPTEARV